MEAKSVSNPLWPGHTMEWKEKIGMEWLKYVMEQIFHIPYKFHTCTFWHGVAEVCFFFHHISKRSLSSARTVIRKLRSFFVIFVTNRSLILILFSIWWQGTLLPDFCMFTSVLPACHCVRQDSYLASIASNVAL